MTVIRDPIYWDGSFAAAVRLRQERPQVDLEAVSLEMIYNWVVALPEFADDPELANDELLLDIYREWYELGGTSGG